MKNAKSIYIEEDNLITIIDDTDFDIQHILACGQIFRYKKLDNAYIIYARDQKIEVYCQKGGFKIFAQNLNFVKKTTAKPDTKNANVDSKKGEPKTAPKAISLPMFTSCPNTTAPIIATSGTIVSGSAVPTAAKILPTTPSSSLYSLPKFSIAFVKIMQSNTINISRQNMQKK